MKNRLEQIVEETLLEILPEIGKNDVDIRSVIFFGPNGVLDSLALVSFTVILEEKIADDFNANISLANEKALSSHNSPFKNFHSLVDYIQTFLPAETAHA